MVTVIILGSNFFIVVVLKKIEIKKKDHFLRSELLIEWSSKKSTPIVLSEFIFLSEVVLTVFYFLFLFVSNAGYDLL